MRRDYDLGLLVPLREEFDRAREVFEFGEAVSEGSYYLHPFEVPGTGLRGIALVLFEMGLTGSAVAATWLLDRFEFGVLAVVGIAGALEPELRLGDVVIASSVDEYLVAAKATAGPDRYNFEVAGASWVASRDLVSYAHNFRYLGDGFEAWQRRAGARLPVASELARPKPEYLVEPIASGDVVGADEAFARWLRQHNRFRAALEMEAGGVARAIYRSGKTELLVVRGISDFADKRKKDLDDAAGPGDDRGAWRRYAALNAVDLLAALVANPAFPWTTTSTPAEPEEVHRCRLTFEELERQLGGDHRRTLVARNDLARACNAAGRFDLARPHYEAVLGGFVKAKGALHPDTLTARSNLAATYRAAGRLAEAIALDEQVLGERTGVLGGTHPDTLNSRNNLAADHFETGDVARAITLLEHVVAGRVLVLGPDHPDTRAARDNLAVAWEVQLASPSPGGP
jgi:nucleoside phosphorylase